jgi:hypothetical protein
MLRRKADWTLLCTIIGMVATVIFYGVRAVQAHVRWMDRVTTASALEPRVEMLEKKSDATSIQYAMIIRELDEIHREIKKL